MKIQFTVLNLFNDGSLDLSFSHGSNKILQYSILDSTHSRNELDVLRLLKGYKNIKDLEIGFGEAYMGKVDKKRGTVYIWDELSADSGAEKYNEGVVDIEEVIKVLELWIREQEEFEKNPKAYQIAIERGEKEFEIKMEDTEKNI